MLAVTQVPKAPQLCPQPAPLDPPPFQLVETSTVLQAPSAPRLRPQPAPLDPPPFQLVETSTLLQTPSASRLCPKPSPLDPPPFHLDDSLASPYLPRPCLVPLLDPVVDSVVPLDLEMPDLVATPAVFDNEGDFFLNVCTVAAKSLPSEQQPVLHGEKERSGSVLRVASSLKLAVVDDIPCEEAKSVAGEMGKLFASEFIAAYGLFRGGTKSNRASTVQLPAKPFL